MHALGAINRQAVERGLVFATIEYTAFILGAIISMLIAPSTAAVVTGSVMILGASLCLSWTAFLWSNSWTLRLFMTGVTVASLLIGITIISFSA